jgi:hypothetical protein
MSPNRPNASLFQHGQDHIAIEDLLVLRTGLETSNHSRKHEMMSAETQRDYGDKDRIKKQLRASQVFHRAPCGRVQETTVKRVQFKL